MGAGGWHLDHPIDVNHDQLVQKASSEHPYPWDRHQERFPTPSHCSVRPNRIQSRGRPALAMPKPGMAAVHTLLIHLRQNRSIRSVPTEIRTAELIFHVIFSSHDSSTLAPVPRIIPGIGMSSRCNLSVHFWKTLACLFAMIRYSREHPSGSLHRLDTSHFADREICAPRRSIFFDPGLYQNSFRWGRMKWQHKRVVFVGSGWLSDFREEEGKSGHSPSRTPAPVNRSVPAEYSVEINSGWNSLATILRVDIAKAVPR